MNGTGVVRDLRTAASLSPALAAVLQSYVRTETHAGQQTQLDNLVDSWAQSST